MSAGAKIAIGAAVGLGAGLAFFAMRGCAGAEVDSASESGKQAYNNQCIWPIWGTVAAGGVLGYFAGR